MFLIFFAAGASAQVYHYSGGNITDSAGIITFKKPVRMMNINQDFGFGSTLWNFRLENDEGTITWRANNDRDLMVYDDDGHIWDFTGTVKINGVTISPGGGDAYLTNRQTFTKRNIFSDTLKADALSLMEQVRIADWFQITGDVISDLNFLKGSSTSIGTISTDSLAIITNNTNRIVITNNGYMSFLDSVKLNNYTFADSLYTKNITPNDGFGLVWTNPSSIKSVSGSLLFNSSSHNFNTQYGTFLAIIDSTNGLQLSKDIDTAYMDVKVFKTNNLDTTRFLDQSDTSSFARLAAFITETFNSYVTFAATVTFSVSPVFSALVNFANGISTTTITASSTATFDGDVRMNGFRNNYRDTTVKKKLGNAGSVLYVPHGIASGRWVSSVDVLIWEDSIQRKLVIGYAASTGTSTGNTVSINDTSLAYFTPGNSVNIGHNPNCAGCTDNDSIFVTFHYLKP